MIRKPDAREFRDSDTVLAIRDMGTVTIEGARGIRDGTAQFLGRGLGVLLGLGFLLSMARHLGPLAMLLTGAGALALFLRSTHSDTAADAFARGAGGAGGRAREERYELSVGAVARKAAKAGVLAILCFPTRAFIYMLPMGLLAVFVLAVTMLSLARLVGDRSVLRFDDASITVRGLLGPSTMLWGDVTDVAVRKASLFNLKVRLASGSRHNLVVRGPRNRLGGAATLFIPIDLLALDGAALAGLVSRLIALADESLSSGAPRSAAMRSKIETRAKPDTGFDPDAVIARYVAERQVRAESEDQGIASRGRVTFGRKATS